MQHAHLFTYCLWPFSLNSHNNEETGTPARGCARAIGRQSEEQKQPGSVAASWEEMKKGGGRKWDHFIRASKSPVSPGHWVPSSQRPMSFPLGLDCGLWASARAKFQTSPLRKWRIPSPQKNDSLIDTLEMTPLYKTKGGRASPSLRDSLLAWAPGKNWRVIFSVRAGRFKLLLSSRLWILLQFSSRSASDNGRNWIRSSPTAWCVFICGGTVR